MVNAAPRATTPPSPAAQAGTGDVRPAPPAQHRLRKLGGLVRDHAAILIVLAVAAGLRLVMMRVYPYAFFLPDSVAYSTDALHRQPNPTRPFGYSAFLTPFLHRPMTWVSAAQHGLALALMVGAYAFLCRRGLRRWLAALAVAPIGLAGRELTLEHLVLAETLFVVLAGAALLVLCWRQRITVLTAGVAGLLISMAALTRTIGLPLAALCVLYLLVRRAGWRPLATFALALALPLGGYLWWYHDHTGVYAFNQAQGRFLYGRVMTFADCNQLTLTTKERVLCDFTPVGQRPLRTDWYVWNAKSPATRYAGQLSDDPLLNSFAKKAISQQPGDYLRMVVRETGWHLLPKPPPTASFACGLYELPERPGNLCRARNYYAVASPDQWPRPGLLRATPVRVALHDYSKATSMASGPLFAVLLLGTLIGAFWRPRRGGWRHTWDALLYAGFGFGLIVGSVATSMYEPRYSVPALFFLPVGAALALHRVGTLSATTATAAR